MKTVQHKQTLYLPVVVYLLALLSACVHETSARADELGCLVRGARAGYRGIWWPAVQELGELGASDPALRAEIWRRSHVNTLGMKFVRIEPGRFTMGPDADTFDVQVAHQVRITRPFHMAVTEVTNQQFATLFPDYRPDAKFSPDADSPAVHVKWEQAAEFCKRLSEREGAVYRLPTEAEWEYACRAGATTLFSFGPSAEEMSRYGRCMNDAWTRAAPVAQLQPNAWGLYDMHGNVFEWVADYYSDDYYEACANQGIVEDPKGPDSGRVHVIRSSGWQVPHAEYCTCTVRWPLPTFDKKPFAGDKVGIRATIGFRVVREVGESEVGGAGG